MIVGETTSGLTQQLAAQDLQAGLHGIMWSGSSSTVLMVLWKRKKTDREAEGGRGGEGIEMESRVNTEDGWSCWC